MLSQNDRWIHRHELLLLTKPPVDYDAPDLRQLLTSIAYLVDAGEAVKLKLNDTQALRVRALQIVKDTATMLIQFCDKDSTDPAFQQLVEGDLRVEEKLDGEGIACSAHFVVSLVPNEAGRYPACLEHVPGIPASKVTEALSFLFRSLSLEATSDVDNTPFKYRIYADLFPMLREKLRTDLQVGHLTEIEFYSDVGNAEEIDGVRVQTQRRTVKLKVLGQPKEALAGRIIAKLREKYRKQGLRNTRVRVGSSIRMKWVDVPVHLEEALEAFSTDQFQIKSASPLAQCAESINGKFVMEMLKKL